MANPCPACRAAVRLATGTAEWMYGVLTDRIWKEMVAAYVDFKAAQHSPDCPNQERS